MATEQCFNTSKRQIPMSHHHGNKKKQKIKKKKERDNFLFVRLVQLFIKANYKNSEEETKIFKIREAFEEENLPKGSDEGKMTSLEVELFYRELSKFTNDNNSGPRKKTVNLVVRFFYPLFFLNEFFPYCLT